MRFALSSLVVAGLVASTTGCLSSQYVVAHDELERIAQTPPEARGEVHATQRMSTDTQVERISAAPYGSDREVDADGNIVFFRPTFFGGGYYQGPRTQWRGGWHGETRNAVGSGGYYGPGRGPSNYTGPSTGNGGSGGNGGRTPATPGVNDSGRTAANPRVSGSDTPPPSQPNGPRASAPSSGSSTSSGSSSKIGDPSKAAAAAVVIAVAVVAASVVVGIVFAVSEADRFKGTVQIAGDHPVYLRDENGLLLGWVPLYALDISQIPVGGDAIIAKDDGPIVNKQAAPLDRKGVSYTVDLGASGLNRADRTSSTGASARFGLGGFPVQEFGIYAGVNFTFGRKQNPGLLVDTRPHVEAQVWPIRLNTLHVGAYGEAGYVFGEDQINGINRNTNGLVLGAGALGQVAISTLVAATLRAGLVRLDSATSASYAPNVTLGLSVY